MHTYACLCIHFINNTLYSLNLSVFMNFNTNMKNQDVFDNVQLESSTYFTLELPVEQSKFI